MKRSSGSGARGPGRGRDDRGTEAPGDARCRGAVADSRSGWGLPRGGGYSRRGEDDGRGEDQGRGEGRGRSEDGSGEGRGEAGIGLRDGDSRDAGEGDHTDRLDRDDRDNGRRGKPQPSAYGKALGLLTRREHSGRELKRKLARTGYSADETSEALGRLQEQSFQSDDRFAGLLVRSRVGQGQGPRRIRAELRSHGIDDAAAQQALLEEGTDWLALARQIYRRRYGTGAAAGRQETQRRAAFLLRRGFDAATVRAITHADDVDDSAEEFD